MRLKFGPKLGTLRLARPAVAGELPDVDVTAEVGDASPGASGTVSVPVLFAVPAYAPGKTHTHLVAVFAVPVPGGTPEPTDPAEAIKLPGVASGDTSGHTAGGTVTVTLDGLQPAPTTLLTVLGFEDPDPAPADGASTGPAPAAQATADAPATS